MLKLSDRGKWILKRRQRSTKTNFMYVCIYTYMLYLYHTGVTFLVFRDGFFGNVFPTTLSMKQDFKYCQRQKSELKSNYTHWKTARFLKICTSLQNAFTTPCVFLGTIPGLPRLVGEHPSFSQSTRPLLYIYRIRHN